MLILGGFIKIDFYISSLKSWSFVSTQQLLVSITKIGSWLTHPVRESWCRLPVNLSYQKDSRRETESDIERRRGKGVVLILGRQEEVVHSFVTAYPKTPRELLFILLFFSSIHPGWPIHFRITLSHPFGIRGPNRHCGWSGPLIISFLLTVVVLLFSYANIPPY